MDFFFSFEELTSRLLALLSLQQFGINVLDIIIIVVILFYSYEGYVLGFGRAALDFVSFILSFVFGLLLFDTLSPVLVSLFSIPQGFANAISFFIIALVGEIIFSLLSRRIVRIALGISEKRPLVAKVGGLNHYLGVIPGLASAYVILSFLLTIVIALPSSPLLKQLVTASAFGSSLVSHTASIQHALSDVFGGAIQDTLNVMTIKPQSEETVNLHFTVSSPIVDPEAEEHMLAQVNHERVKRGLPRLIMDQELRELARLYAKDMFQRGYFSHYNPEGQSPFDRMNEAGIIFIHAGENLALAPSTPLAHQGLMNSPGHKANILGKDFRKVGIGVMDGGIYGKMFVQEFTD